MSDVEIDLEKAGGTESSSGGGTGTRKSNDGVQRISLNYGTKEFRQSNGCYYCDDRAVGIAVMMKSGDGDMKVGRNVCRDHFMELEGRAHYEYKGIEFYEY